MKTWLIRLDLCNPIDDTQLDTVRQHLTQLLAEAGHPVKTTTYQAWIRTEHQRPLKPAGPPPAPWNGQTTQPKQQRRNQ